MRVKKASDTQKRHYQTFHLARRNPERWEHERGVSLSESLHEAWERTGVAEREVETNKKMLRHNQQQVGIFVVRGGGPLAQQSPKIDHLGKRLAASETAREDLRQINTRISEQLKSKNEALEKISNDHSRSRSRISSLYKEVRRLRVKTLRAPGQRSRAVKAAISKAASKFKAQSNAYRIKRPDGRIENWVRDLSCRLIAIRHLPASQTPGAISDILQAIRTHTGDLNGTDNDGISNHVDPGDVETFSDRSARRFPLEGNVMGKIQLAKEFKAAPG